MNLILYFVEKKKNMRFKMFKSNTIATVNLGSCPELLNYYDSCGASDTSLLIDGQYVQRDGFGVLKMETDLGNLVKRLDSEVFSNPETIKRAAFLTNVIAEVDYYFNSIAILYAS